MDTLAGEVLLASGVLGVLRATAEPVLRRFAGEERKLIETSFWLKAVFVVANLLVTTFYFGGGDMTGYLRWGALLASDPTVDMATLWAMFLQQAAAENSSTIAVGALSGIIQTVLGPFQLPTCLIVGIAAWVGQLAMYVVMAARLPPSLQRTALMSCMFLPSVVFWTAGIIKEAVAVAGLGLVLLGAHQLTLRKVHGVIAAAIGFVLIATVKAYILVPTSAAVVVAYLLGQRRTRIGVGLLIRASFGVVLAALAVDLVGDLFPRYSLETLDSVSSTLQQVGQRVRGGSTYDIDTSGGVAGMAPVAVLTALLRPSILDVRNAATLINSIEMTAVLFLVFRIVRYTGIRIAITRVIAHPALLFCVIFVALMAVGVGLGSSNLGTLSRYRSPMMPFYVILLLAMAWPTNAMGVRSSSLYRWLSLPFRRSQQ